MTETTNHDHAEWLETVENVVGITREEALARLADDDLWLLHPEQRFAGTVEEWQEAARIIENLADAGHLLAHSPAARAILEDARERCALLAERTRRRTT